MKYKPGSQVVVTRVPQKAAMFVEVGMPAVVQTIEPPELAKAAADFGMTAVKIGFFTYWWNEDDLGLHQ